MKAVITTSGTRGDITPFLQIGAALASRGNDILLVSHCEYKPLAKHLGLRFEAQDTPSEYAAFLEDAHWLDSPQHISKFAHKHIFPKVKREFELFAHLCSNRDTVLIARHMSIAASLASEWSNIPLVSVFNFASQANCFDLWVSFCGSVLGNKINESRIQLGLPPVSDWETWTKRPAAFLACWPDWFASSTAVWPVKTKHVGFLSCDLAESGVMPPHLESVLSAITCPILITTGTSVSTRAKQVCEIAAEACFLGGYAAIIICQRQENTSFRSYPDHLLFEQLPFTTVMPRVKLVIHHGGAGTMVRCIAAGVPQLIMAYGADRPFNAYNVERLGIGIQMKPQSWKPALVAEQISRLMGNEQIQRNLATAQCKATSPDDLTDACEFIEALAKE